MNGWSLSVEAFSLVITIILMINFHDKKPVSRQSRLYQSILWLSVFTIGWNILCVWTIEYASLFPLWINELLNTQYFILLILLCTLIAYYLICAVLEHLYSRQYLRRVAWILGLVMGIYLVAILTNPWTGAIFRFDEQGYHRGPWINLGYAVMGFDLAFLGLCYLQHWHRVSRPIRRVMFVLPTTVVCMTVFQLMYPEVLLNGSIIVVANLILFLNFQMRRLDTDSLTCLGNRSHFYGYLSQHLAAHQNCQILVVSLRQFGMVNQRLGHRRGDGILYEIACWLDRFHRQGRAFRLSNVSFALLLPYTTAAQADCNRKRVQKRFAESWRLGSAEVTLGCSMAELCYTGQPWSAEEMLEFLEYGLQQAEESENGVVRFDLQMHEQFLRRQKLLVLMRRGIVENRFSVWYQPLYHCISGRFCSAEALLRLRDETGRIISPGEFIPLAEAEIFNLPGSDSINVSGALTEIPIASGEFTEEQTNGSPAKQTLSANVTDTGQDTSSNLRQLFSQEGILVIQLTSGEQKVVGTDEFPVLVTMTQSGSPAAYQLTFDRESPEPAKFLQSF